MISFFLPFSHSIAPPFAQIASFLKSLDLRNVAVESSLPATATPPSILHRVHWDVTVVARRRNVILFLRRHRSCQTHLLALALAGLQPVLWLARFLSRPITTLPSASSESQSMTLFIDVLLPEV